MGLSLHTVVVFIILARGEGMRPRFVDELRNVTVEVGRDATFTCTVSDIHGYRIGWVKANTKAIQAIGTHVITHNTRISVSHDDSRRKWSLHIADAQLDDTGPYMCQINTDPMRSKMGFLDVIITPDIVDIRGPSVVVEGGSAKLECEARGEPTPLVFWQRENTREKPGIINRSREGKMERRSRVDGSVLRLHKITREDAGGYLCIASNGHPPAISRRLQLDVKYRPAVSVPNQHVRGVIGKTVALQCDIDSFPRAEVSWTKRDDLYEEIVTGGRYIKEDFHITDYKTRSVLNIYNYTKQDAGLYDCKARNEMNLKGETADGVIYLNTEKEPTTESVYTTPYFIYTDYDLSPGPSKPFLTYNPQISTRRKSGTESPRRVVPHPTPERFLNSSTLSQCCGMLLIWSLSFLHLYFSLV